MGNENVLYITYLFHMRGNFVLYITYFYWLFFRRMLWDLENGKIEFIGKKIMREIQEIGDEKKYLN